MIASQQASIFQQENEFNEKRYNDRKGSEASFTLSHLSAQGSQGDYNFVRDLRAPIDSLQEQPFISPDQPSNQLLPEPSHTGGQELVSIDIKQCCEEQEAKDPSDLLKIKQEICLSLHNYEREVVKEPEYALIRVKPTEKVLKALSDYSAELSRQDSNQCSKMLNQKNFSKKFGDQLCKYLFKVYDIKCNSKFKDKISWKLLNRYLAGEKMVSRKLTAAAFVKCFQDFVRSYDLDSLNEAKTNENSKLFYKICAVSLKLAFQELDSLTENNLAEGIVIIKKAYPETILEYHYK